MGSGRLMPDLRRERLLFSFILIFGAFVESFADPSLIIVILAFIVGIRVVVGYSLNQELKELPSAPI
jgi:uncharacterized membrane protein